MLANYIDKAMETAIYEIIEDDNTYWGEIPNFQGVQANSKTLDGCRNELKEALGDWIAFRLKLGLEIPVKNGQANISKHETVYSKLRLTHNRRLADIVTGYL